MFVLFTRKPQIAALLGEDFKTLDFGANFASAPHDALAEYQYTT